MKYTDKIGNNHDNLTSAYLSDIKNFCIKRKENIVSFTIKKTQNIFKFNKSQIKVNNDDINLSIKDTVNYNIKNEIVNSVEEVNHYDNQVDNIVNNIASDSDNCEAFNKEQIIQKIAQNAINKNPEILNEVETDHSIIQDIAASTLTKIDDVLLKNQDELESTVGNITTSFLSNLSKGFKK